MTRKPVDRKVDALRRLGVEQAEVDRMPQVTSILIQAEGGLNAVLGALRFSMELPAQLFVEKYDSIPVGDRATLSWEAICIAAQVSPANLLGAAMLALQNVSANTVKIVALTNHPRVMNARIAAAVLPGGHQDRNAFQTGIGFLPSPKGPTFINNVKTDVRRDEDEDDEDEGVDSVEYDAADEMDHLFPPVAQMQERLQPIRQKSLGDGK